MSLHLTPQTVQRRPLGPSNTNTQAFLANKKDVKVRAKADSTGGGLENDKMVIIKHHHSVKKLQTASVTKRNLRERTRVRGVNDGFGKLKQYVPNMRNKSSKVETLRGAIEYIKQLKELLGEEMNDSNSMKADYDDCTGMIKILILEFIIMFNIFRRVLFL